MNVVIVGGGVAGWMTSLYIKTEYPKYKVTLIQSNKIGTVGVGEGTVPSFIGFLIKVGINLKDFYNKVPTTTKLGVNFIDWNKSKTSYVHDFDVLGIGNKNSIHFDSSKLLEYLSNYGKSIGILNVIDEIENHNLSKYDFTFDCTGFHRSILKQSWVDCSKWLPFNCALPFTIKPISKERTQAIATDKGWIWQIPLPTRTGCGYVYNNKVNSEIEIINHIKSLYPNAIIPRKSLSFNPGYQNNVWEDNCIAIGLSSSFFEPIEATSLMTVVWQLYQLPSSLNIKHREIYNDNIRCCNEQIMSFIRYHYLCDRKDGNWKNINNIPLPLKLDQILLNNKMNIFNNEDLYKIFKVKENNCELFFHIQQYNVFSNNNFRPLINSLI